MHELTLYLMSIEANPLIKNAERATRGSSSGIPFKTIAPGHTIKQWRNFLSCSENKNCLIQFLVNDWCTDGHRQRLQLKGQGKELYVTVGEICKILTVE